MFCDTSRRSKIALHLPRNDMRTAMTSTGAGVEGGRGDGVGRPAAGESARHVGQPQVLVG